MSSKAPRAGEVVTVKAGHAKMSPSVRTCRIVGVLPNDHGEVQYRVRFEGETFDRRIVATDIEATGAALSEAEKPSTELKRGSWLESARIRISK